MTFAEVREGFAHTYMHGLQDQGIHRNGKNLNTSLGDNVFFTFKKDYTYIQIQFHSNFE